MSNNQPKSESSLPPCEICQKKIAIYCCPRCSIRTCSLTCCRSHKAKSKDSGGRGKETEICSGKRDRTKFCSLKQFTDSHLASDYHFLEDVLKLSESSKRIYQGLTTGDSSAPALGAAKRARVNTQVDSRVGLDSIAHQPPVHPLLKAKDGKSIADVLANGLYEVEPNEEESGQSPFCISAIQKQLGEHSIDKDSQSNKPPALPVSTKRDKVEPLVRQAELKGINLLRMPSGMERHKSNTTTFNKKSGAITWKIELCFHQSSKLLDGDKKTNDESCPSGVDSSPKMLKVESQMAESSTLSQELGKHLDVHPGNSATRSRLRSFASAPREKLLFLMKRLPCSSAAPQYFKFDCDATLMDCLNGKTIIEFPTIDVIFEEEMDKFPLFIGEMS